MELSGAGNALHSALKAAAMTHCRNSPRVAIGIKASINLTQVLKDRP